MVLAAMFLALAMVLPFLTGQIREIGNALCPMHIPVLLCGFFSGPWYALAVGFASPLLRFLIVGVPPILPRGLAMSFELAAYGFVSGTLYKALPEKKSSVYLALIGAMIAGRIVWGAVSVILYGICNTSFGMKAFLAGAFLNSLPGIIIQIVLIPIIVMAIKKQPLK